jgi:hypothetical protein
MGAKEGQHIRIELPMEGGAVETRRIRADFGRLRRQLRRTKRQKGEMPGVWHHMILVLYAQVFIH